MRAATCEVASVGGTSRRPMHDETRDASAPSASTHAQDGRIRRISANCQRETAFDKPKSVFRGTEEKKIHRQLSEFMKNVLF